KFGLQRGKDINGLTQYHATNYTLTLPGGNADLLKGGLQCMRDYAGEILLTPKNIEVERGDVLAEIRRSSESTKAQIIPTLLGKSTYAERMTADGEAVVRTFKHESLIRFYNDWYRPELQSVIIVGDVDVKSIEAQIIKLFSDMPPGKG